MGWFSGLFGKTAGRVDSLVNSPFTGFEDYFTGASSARRSYRYNAALQEASQAFNAGEAAKAFERQKDLQRLEDEYTRGYFDYVSAYNTPVKQMERLREAGLNPNLVYGNGAMAVQAATPVQGVPHAPQAAGSGVGGASGGVAQSLGGILGGVTGVFRDLANIKESAARTKEADARQELLKSQKTGQDLSNLYDRKTGMFGHGRFGNFVRTVLGLKAMFPDQYSFVKDWIVKKFNGVNTSGVGKMFDGLFRSSGTNGGTTNPVIINQHFSHGAGQGYMPDLKK